MLSTIILLMSMALFVSAEPFQFGNKFSTMNARTYMGCFKSVQRPDEVLKDLKNCVSQSKLDSMIKDIKKNKQAPEVNALMPIIESIVSCMQVKQKVLDSNGKLQIENILKILDKLEGDQTKIDALKEIAKTCFNKVDSTDISAAKHDLRISKCSMQEQLKYCQEKKEDPGKLAIIVAMMTLKDQSVCKSVQVIDKLEPVIKKCKGGDSSTKKKKFSGRPDRRRRNVDVDPKMRRAMLCIGKEMKYLDEETGIDYEAYIAIVKAFPGWEGITDEQTKVVEGIKACKIEAPMVKISPEEVRKQYPWLKDTSPLTVQFIKFTKCMLPKLAEICGMRNQLALFMFPPLSMSYPKSILDEITGGKFDLSKKTAKALEDDEAMIVALDSAANME